MEVKKHEKETKKGKDFSSSRNTILKTGILFGFLFLVIFYICSSSSRVNAVHISGNHYLDDSYIKQISSCDTGDVYYLSIPLIKEWRLKNDPMIQDATVSLSNDGVINIEVTEKKAIGYRYDDDTPVILLSDNTTAQLKSEYLDIIASVPLISGFNEAEQTRLLTKAFAEVDQSIIESISEITQFSLSYDDEAMKIHMRNGGYFIGNYQNVDKLNQYYAIYSAMKDKSQCISADENSAVAYSYTCPWNETETATEYWTDEDGNVITNEYGDKVVKHYYKDEDGNPVLDSSGNQIAIPIDENGNEAEDADFTSHYEAGYYATGELVLPDWLQSSSSDDTQSDASEGSDE